MIKANETRIGNFVEFENSIFKIHTISEVYPTLDTPEFGICVIDWNNIQPIPLTEEWLLKFGFNKIQGDKIFFEKDVFGNTPIKFEKKNIPFSGEQMCLCISNFFTSRIKYVHQLQNIYFALTGDELTIVK